LRGWHEEDVPPLLTYNLDVQRVWHEHDMPPVRSEEEALSSFGIGGKAMSKPHDQLPASGLVLVRP
jgi:hypothetical protein